MGRADAEPAGLGDGVHVHQAHRDGDQRADDHRQQHGDLAEEALQELREDHDQHDDQPGEQHLGDGPEVRVAGVAGDQADVGADERQADDRDHDAGDQRREEPDHPAEVRRGDDAEDAGDQERAIDGRQPLLAAHDDHRGQHRERGAGRQRQPDAEPLGQAGGLDDRDDAADQQVGVDEHRDVGLGQPEGAPDDERHRDGARVHDEQVLQAQREQLDGRQHLVHLVDGPLRGRGRGLGHG